MNRQITFRAWDITIGKWILNSDKMPFSVIGEVTMFDCINQYRLENLNDIVLMQNTGFKSKDGKQIYESDLVSFLYKNPSKPLDKMGLVICEVVWNQKCGMWSLKWSDGYINSHPLMDEKYELVGNIYDKK